jgi:hypothetical protein
MMLALAISMVAGLQAGNASRYGYVGDVWNQAGTYACRGSLQALYGERRWRTMRDHGVAHRTLACGTPLTICNLRTGRCTAAYVVDRGPYGALDRRGVWHARVPPLRPGEHYRGELDLLPGVYSAISLVGIERVMFWQLPMIRTEPARQQRVRPRVS